MTTKRIMVIGSTNTDMVIKTDNFPTPGETLLGGQFLMNPGGKGANQAVAASRLGGIVSFLGKIGDDIFGHQAKQLLQDEGIDVGYVCVDPEKPSGVALIIVNQEGENTIVVAPGSNGELSPADIEPALPLLEKTEFVLLQLEIPLETVIYIAEIATRKGKKVVLNPAPAIDLPEDLLKNLYLITPNETEAGMLTGIQVKDEGNPLEAAKKLKGKGVDVVVITMGSRGAFVLSDEYIGMVDAPKVRAVDTTAAGDTFNGALLVALSEDKPLEEAVGFACNAASISVTRNGAQASVPYRKELP